MNRKEFLKFFVVLTAVAALLFLIYTLLVNQTIIPAATYDLEMFLIQYFMMLIIFFLLLKALSLEPAYFIQIAMLSIVVKLVIYAVAIFIIIYRSPASAYPNVILFLSIYLVFTALTVGMLYPAMNSQQKETQNRR